MSSPQLFTEFLTDLKEYMDISDGITVEDIMMMYLLFADDLVLFGETPDALQNQINCLFKYVSHWHLIVSIVKTKILIINKRYAQNVIFYYNGTRIDEVEEFKYLGVLFCDSIHCLQNTCDMLVKQAWKALYALKKLYRPILGKLSPTLAFKVFDCQLLPILEYGSEVWFNGQQSEEIEKMQLSYLKTTIGVRTQTPTHAVYGDTGRFPLYLRQQMCALKYWMRILKFADDHPVKSAYNMSLRFEQLGYKNWCSHIHNILIEMGYPEVWDTQKVINEHTFLSEIQKKMYSNFTDAWANDITDSVKHPKLRTYSQFKKTFCTEPYITQLKGNHLITCLAKFRTSSHNLQIERGRYTQPKTPINKRLCTRCNMNAIDDERHFILHCEKLVTLRQLLFQICCDNISNFNFMSPTDKFMIIMTSVDIKIITALSQFVYNGFKHVTI